MRKKLFANWGIKLISLLVAFSLWFVVVFFEDPPQEETFVNIPVQFVNTERLTDEGLVYEVLDNTDVVKRVTVTGPQTVVAAMRSRGSECIIATADFADPSGLSYLFPTLSLYSGLGYQSVLYSLKIQRESCRKRQNS